MIGALSTTGCTVHSSQPWAGAAEARAAFWLAVTTLMRYRHLLAGQSRQHVRTKVDSGRLVRVHRGVYAARPPNQVDQLRALFLRLPAGTLLSHQSAAEALGFGVLPSDKTHVLIPVGVPRPQLSGVITHEAILPVSAPVTASGVACVPAARCAVDLARGGRRLDAIAILDASLRTGRCSRSDLRAEVSRHARLRGVRQARELIELADGRSECTQESHLRLTIIDGSLPAPEPQVWVGRYRLDLGYRERRVGVEYDGRSHMDRDRFRADRIRMNWLAAQGWTMRYFTDFDLYRRPSGIVAAVRAALR